MSTPFDHPLLFFLIVPRLVHAVYINSLLATLNARGSLLGGHQGKIRLIKAPFRESCAVGDYSRDQGIEVRTVLRWHSQATQLTLRGSVQFMTITSADILSSKHIADEG